MNLTEQENKELIETLKQDIATRKSAEFEEDFIADMMKAALEKAEEEAERTQENEQNG